MSSNIMSGLADRQSSKSPKLSSMGGGMDGGSGDMGSMDWAGMGMQVGGAILSDMQKKNEEKKRLEREDMLRKLMMQREDAANQRAYKTADLRQADAMHISNRSQNLQGLEYLNNLTDANAKTGRTHPFYTNLFGGL